MAEKVQIDLEVNSNLEPTIANLKALKKQLKEAAAGSADFNKLSAQIRDMDDAIKDASATSDDFAGYLENASGPLGMLGKGLRGAEKTFSSFNAVLKTSVIGIIVAAIGGLVAAFSQSETAVKKLQPLMIAFEKILGGIFKAFEPLLDGFIELATQVLPYITKGIGMFYSGLFSLFTLIKNVGVSAGQLLKGIFTLDFDALKEGAAGIKDAFTGISKTFEDTYKRFEEGTKEQTKTEKENAAERAKNAADAAAKRKAAEEKEAAEKKKRDEEAAKALLDGNQVLTEAYLATLSQRDQDIYAAGVKQNERLAKLQAAGLKDNTAILEQGRLELAAINQKYDDEEAKKKEDDAKKEADRIQKEIDDAKKLADDKLSYENSLLESGANLAQKEFDLKRANNEATFKDQRDTFEKIRAAGHEAMAANVAAGKANADDLTAYEKETAAMRISNKKNEEAVKLQAVSGALDAVAALVDEGSTAGKAISIAKAIINTYQGATMALGAYPPPFNFIAAAATVAAGFMNVNKIINTKVPSIKPGGGDVPSSSAAAPSITAPTVAAMATPQIQTQAGQNPTSQIASTLSSASGKPVRAYVVGQDITSQQALDRRTSTASTFG